MQIAFLHQQQYQTKQNQECVEMFACDECHD